MTEQTIKSAEPKPKNYKLFDGYGLFLLVSPAGGKHFKLAYRHDGKQNTLAIGSWSIISLAKARNLAYEAKEQLSKGIDPSISKKSCQTGKNSYQRLTNPR